MILSSTTKISLLFFFSMFLYAAKAQTNIAQQTSLTAGWYNGLSNYEDPMDPGFIQYGEVGQTFSSTLTTSISTVEFYVQGFNNAGNVHVEVYSCSGPYAWGTLLGTKTNVSISGNGWVTADLSTLNIQVISGNYYGFKLIPQYGLRAGLGVKNADVYTNGDAWWGDGMGSEDFDYGLDVGFRITGTGILPVDFTSFNAIKQNEKALLTWAIATAGSGNGFIIEHRTNSGNWQTIGSLPPSPISNNSFTFTHNNPVKGSNYYRIAEVDNGGKHSYSEIRELYFGDNNKDFELVGSNPVISGKLIIKTYAATALSFYNAEGKLIWKKEMSAGMHNIDLGAYPKAIYFLRSADRTEKVLVQ